MWFERIVAEGLSHNSYMIGSGGKAAVIDPRRDCGVYLILADRHDTVITHIFETHRNEDYVSGAPELAHRCNAPVYHGSRMDFAYGNGVREGDRFTLGTLELSVIETPGHTEESITLVLVDTEVSREPYMVFSGDTLFSGDIARTDFFGPEEKRRWQKKCMRTSPGRSCHSGTVRFSARPTGPVLHAGAKLPIIPSPPSGTRSAPTRSSPSGRKHLSPGALPSPRTCRLYFRQMETVNREGPALLHSLPRTHPLSVAAVKSLVKSGSQIVDIRSPTAFAAGHIPGSFSIWRDGIASFAGWFLDYERPVVLVDDFSLDLQPVLRQSVRLGYDATAGWLAGGFPAWFRAAQPVGMTGTCTVQALRERLNHEKPFLLDVRDQKNREHVGHISGSISVYIGELPRHLQEIPKDRPVVIYCDSGYKGSLGASVLAMNGFSDVTNVLGGMQAWVLAGYPFEK